MKFKLSKSRICIMLILLCICQWFAVFKTGGFIYKADFINLTAIIVSSLFIFMYSFKPFTQKFSKNYFKVWIVFGLFIYVIECIHSTFLYSQYGQGIIDSLATSYSNLVLIVYFPLVYLQEKIDDIDYLKEVFKTIGFIAAILSIIQVFLYNYGVVFLDITGTSIRNGTLRFGIAGHISSIAFLITLFDYFYKRKNIDLIRAILEALFFIYALKTRTEIMYIILAICIVCILFLKKKNAKYLMVFAGLAVVCVLAYNGFFNTYVTELGDDAGVNMRFLTIEYYMQQFVSHPILGMGFIRSSLNSSLYNILYGNAGYFYRDDVGVIGVMNEKGTLGLIWYVSLLVICFIYAHKLYKKDNNKYIWAIAVCIYITVCSINIVYINSLRIATMVVWVAILYHYYLREFYPNK